MEYYPEVKFIVVYFVAPHEISKMHEIRRRIEVEREGRRPYDLVILSRKELGELLKKLNEWNIPKTTGG